MVKGGVFEFLGCCGNISDSLDPSKFPSGSLHLRLFIIRKYHVEHLKQLDHFASSYSLLLLATPAAASEA